MFMLVACLYLCHLCIVTNGQSWGYDTGELNWTSSYPECGGSFQSPIDIVIDDPADCGQILELEYDGLDFEYFAIKNNGHSLQLTPFHIDYDLSSEVSGYSFLNHVNGTGIRLQNVWYDTYQSPIHQEYCFDSLHFHWSNSNDSGSEHSINGTHFPLELHMVHFACDYYKSSAAQKLYESGDLSEQYDDDNVLAVVAVLFEIGAPNVALDQVLTDLVLDGVEVFHNPGRQLESHLIPLYFSGFNMSELLPTNRSMFAYKGSLTTPPCLETVRWNILRHTMTVSEEQIERIRRLLESNDTNDLVAPNYRAPQALNNRTVFVCQDTLDAMSVTKDTDTSETTTPPMNENEEAEIWFIIALVFIIAFGVTALVCFYLSYTNYAFSHTRDKKDKAKYENNRNSTAKYEEIESVPQ